MAAGQCPERHKKVVQHHHGHVVLILEYMGVALWEDCSHTDGHLNHRDLPLRLLDLQGSVFTLCGPGLWERKDIHICISRLFYQKNAAVEKGGVLEKLDRVFSFGLPVFLALKDSTVTWVSYPGPL